MAYQDEYEAALRQQEAEVEQAWYDTITAVILGSTITAISLAVAAGQVGQAVQAMQVDQRLWGRIDVALVRAFLAGGLWELDRLPKRDGEGAKLLLGFSGRHPRAELHLRTANVALIRELTDDMEQLVQDALMTSVQGGRAPRQVALDLVGRMNRSGRREGGIIGLGSYYAKVASNARAELSDPKTAARFLRRERRDRRFDRTIARSVSEGRKLTQAEVDGITGRYADRLLQLRGETVARTNVIGAFNAGRYEAVQQNVDDGILPRQGVQQIWDATIPSLRTRDTHRELNNQRVPLGQPFVTSTGAKLRYPGDRDLGAPMGEIANCRCASRTKVNWLEMAV